LYSLRNYDRALQLMQRATAMPAKRAAYYDKSEPVQNRLYKSLKVWCMYADLEESLGTFEVGHVVIGAGPTLYCVGVSVFKES